MNKKCKFTSLLLFLGILLAVSVSLQAQQRETGVEGYVKGYEGNPMEGVTVEAKSDRGANVFQTTTDESGHYRLVGLRPGGYTLRLVVEGQTLFQLRDIAVRSGQVQEVELDLQAELERQKKTMSKEQLEQLEEVQAARRKAKSLEATFKQGMEYLKQNQYSEAVTEFEAAAEIDPNQFAVYANLGQAYASANQADKGIEAYQKAIALRQDKADKTALGSIYNNLGQLYLKQGDIEGAKQAFQTAAEMSPESAGAFYYNLGVTLYNADQLTAAIDPLRKATEIDPERADAFYLLGVCLLNAMEYKTERGEVKMVLKPGTRESFQKYLALAPKGKFAQQAKDNLQTIEAIVPASVSVKNKK
jgi:tetratricopeptide (TPR) repeat protein